MSLGHSPHLRIDNFAAGVNCRTLFDEAPMLSEELLYNRSMYYQIAN